MKNVKMFSKVLAILSALALIFNMGSITTAKADTHWTIWKIESSQKNYTTEEVGSWELAYSGKPAQRDGEYDTVSASISRSSSISGSIQLTKGAIAGEVGVELSRDYTIGGSKNSAQLKKGEYIKGYVKQVASVSKVIQRKYEHMGGQDYKTGTTATAYVKKPTAVTIKIEYYKSNGSKKSFSPINEQPTNVEYYYIDNETNETIQLTEEEVNSFEKTTEENENFINYNPEEDETLGLELD